MRGGTRQRLIRTLLGWFLGGGRSGVRERLVPILIVLEQLVVDILVNVVLVGGGVL